MTLCQTCDRELAYGPAYHGKWCSVSCVNRSDHPKAPRKPYVKWWDRATTPDLPIDYGRSRQMSGFKNDGTSSW